MSRVIYFQAVLGEGIPLSTYKIPVKLLKVIIFTHFFSSFFLTVIEILPKLRRTRNSSN